MDSFFQAVFSRVDQVNKEGLVVIIMILSGGIYLCFLALRNCWKEKREMYKDIAARFRSHTAILKEAGSDD